MYIVCNKCKLKMDYRSEEYCSLKGTKLSAGRLGKAFKYCRKCFEDLKILISEYIQSEHNKQEDLDCKECKNRQDEIDSLRSHLENYRDLI